MKFLKVVASAAVAASFAVGSAFAAPVVPVSNNDGVPDIYDAINLLKGTAFTSNADIPLALRIADGSDELFRVLNNGIPLIGLTAANSNTLGVSVGANAAPTFFNPPGTPLFGFTGDGTAANPFAGRDLSSIGIATPEILGFALQSNANTFYTEAARNPDGLDHAIAYDLSSLGAITIWVTLNGNDVEITLNNPILLAFEDILGGGDMDFDDTMYLIDAQVVPLPFAAPLLLTGLAGLGFVGRKKRQA